jgi:hypothetical protein
MSYLDIDNLYKAREILLFRECFALEKIHGSSAHLGWDGGEVRYFAGGEKHENFVALFDHQTLKAKFAEKIGSEKAVVFGEAYGGKCQRMSETYGKHLKFIVFEVRIGDRWLAVPQANDVAGYLGLEFVHYRQIPATIEALDAERDADSVQAVRNGVGEGRMREGIVVRPLIELTRNNGQRIIAKHKREEFSERQHTPRVVDGDKLAVLTRAAEIAEEWVIPMRLEHVLQKLPKATGIEHTGLVVKAMIADVYREAAGEIVEGREVAAAIGRRTAELWKRRIGEAA